MSTPIVASFLKSSAKLKDCPKPNVPEYAFVGRSNVGKSSLINYLVNRKELAKTSGKPGKTQLINHFEIRGSEKEKNPRWYLVDLPGYGYAKVSKSKKDEFQKLIYPYLQHRENLMSVFVLIDSRHEPQPVDIEFMQWLGVNQVPFAMIFTKTDKLKKGALVKNVDAYNEEMLKSWEELPPQFATSSLKKSGGEDILNYIEETNSLFQS
jgi:GTP-binding protein